MLSNLVQILERVVKSLDDGSHTTEGGPLQLFALEQRLRILYETDIVTADGLDEVLCRRELTKRNTEVVGIVESMEEVLVEGMDFVDAGEGLEDGSNLFGNYMLLV